MAYDPQAQFLAQSLLGGGGGVGLPVPVQDDRQLLAQQALARLDPSISAAATAPQPDLRTATLSPDFHPVSVQNQPDVGGFGVQGFGPRLAATAGAAPQPVPASGPAPDASLPVPTPTPQALAQQALAKLAPATGGGPAEVGTSPLDAVRAVQSEMGAGTPGSSSFGSSKSVTKGIPFGPEQKAELGESQKRFDSQVEAIQQQRTDQYAAQIADQRARETALAAQRTDQQAREDERQRILAQRTEAQQAAAKDYMEGKPPEAYGGSWVSGLLATIGQAMGAYGAARTGSPNFAQNLVNGYLDREQKKWEMTQLQKRYGVESMKDLTQQARQEWLETKTDRQATDRLIADAELQRLQTGEKQGDKAQQLQLIRAGNQQEGDKLKLQMEREAQDRATISTHSSSTGGTPGRPASLLDASIKATKEGVITPEEARSVRGQSANEGQGAGARTAAEQTLKGSSDALLDAVGKYLPQMGAKPDPKTGEWRISNWDINKPGGAASILPTSAAHARDALVNVLAPDIASLRVKGNAAPTQDEIAAARKELETWSAEKLENTINTAVKRAHAVVNQPIYHSKRQVADQATGDE